MNIDLPFEYAYEKMRFLCGRYELCANDFYAENLENEKRLYTDELKRMSKLTQNILRSIDYESVKQSRNDNYDFLDKHLRRYNKLILKPVDGPYMYPLYIDGCGERIRQNLLKKKIYISTLWKSVFDVCTPNMVEYDMATNILPIPVDQRYSRDDMQYVVDSIFECIEK